MGGEPCHNHFVEGVALRSHTCITCVERMWSEAVLLVDASMDELNFNEKGSGIWYGNGRYFHE